MSRKRRLHRGRQVEIFNFSFLDILACTIGLLIFIMVMVFVLQAGSPVADNSAIASAKMVEVSSLRESADRNGRIANTLEAQLDLIRTPGVENLSPVRNAARADRNHAQVLYEQVAGQLGEESRRIAAEVAERERAKQERRRRASIELDEAQTRSTKAHLALKDAEKVAPDNRVVFSTHKHADDEGISYDVLHIDCQSTRVVILRVDPTGRAMTVGSTPLDSVSNESSDFKRAIQHNSSLPHPLVIFWVRPDGTSTFGAAISTLPPEIARGYEPADAKWSFGESGDN